MNASTVAAQARFATVPGTAARPSRFARVFALAAVGAPDSLPPLTTGAIGAQPA